MTSVCVSLSVTAVLAHDAEAYDKLQNDLVTAKERLTNIVQSKDRKKTVGRSETTRAQNAVTYPGV